MITRDSLVKVFDFFRLFNIGRGAHKIFLRKEYEKFFFILRWLARFYRSSLLANTHLTVVVGSLGKTTSRRALHVALDCPDRGFAFSNYGAVLASNLLRVRPWDRHAVIEAGISGPGWMKVYSDFLRPDIVVVTSIKSDHFRSFPTLEHTRNEKVEIIRRLRKGKVAFLNGDDPNVKWMASQTVAKVVTFGRSEGNDVRAVNVHSSEKGLNFDAILGNRKIVMTSQMRGEHMVYPLLAALAVAEFEGVDLEQAAMRLGLLQPENSRLEPIKVNDITILDDSYKGGLETIHSALDTLAQIPGKRKLVLYAGVEDPPGKQRDINREIGKHIAQTADVIYWLGGKKSMKAVDAGAIAAGMAPENIKPIGSSILDAATVIEKDLRPGDVLLIKGRGRQRLRRVVLALSGEKVSCSVSYCGVKVSSCDVCPMLSAPAKMFRNHYIARYVRQ